MQLTCKSQGNKNLNFNCKKDMNKTLFDSILF